MSTPPPLPHGLPSIIATFGNAREYVDRKEKWEATVLTTRALRKPLPYAYEPGRTVRFIRAHKLLADELVEALAECLDKGVPLDRLIYGGCYCFRAKRTDMRLSVHSWGAAIDLDPARNPLGKAWQDDGVMLDARILDVFEARGWIAGARWDHPDAMHLQWAAGY